MEGNISDRKTIVRLIIFALIVITSIFAHELPRAFERNISQKNHATRIPQEAQQEPGKLDILLDRLTQNDVLIYQILSRVSDLEQRESELLKEVADLKTRELKLITRVEELDERNLKQIDLLNKPDGSQQNPSDTVNINTLPEEGNVTWHATDSFELSKEQQPKSQDSALSKEKKTGAIRSADSALFVAFYATISDHHIVNAGVNQTIVFDNVITNLGSAYNSHFGCFVAPIPGVYMFSVSLYSVYGTYFHAELVKNNEIVAKFYLDATVSGTYESDSKTVVLELVKGDDVCVHNVDPGKTIHGYHYSTFAGFLLQGSNNPEIVGK